MLVGLGDPLAANAGGSPFDRGASSSQRPRDSPFGDPFSRMRDDPFFSGFGGLGGFGGFGSMLGEGGPFASGSTFSSSFESSFGGGGGGRSTSKTIEVVNGKRTVTTTVVDEQGNKTVTQEFPDGSSQTMQNGKVIESRPANPKFLK